MLEAAEQGEDLISLGLWGCFVVWEWFGGWLQERRFSAGPGKNSWGSREPAPLPLSVPQNSQLFVLWLWMPLLLLGPSEVKNDQEDKAWRGKS